MPTLLNKVFLIFAFVKYRTAGMVACFLQEASQWFQHIGFRAEDCRCKEK